MDSDLKEKKKSAIQTAKVKIYLNTYLWISNSNVKDPINLISTHMFIGHKILVLHVYFMGLTDRNYVFSS